MRRSLEIRSDVVASTKKKQIVKIDTGNPIRLIRQCPSINRFLSAAGVQTAPHWSSVVFVVTA